MSLLANSGLRNKPAKPLICLVPAGGFEPPTY
jgi:hypothetical protein